MEPAIAHEQQSSRVPWGIQGNPADCVNGTDLAALQEARADLADHRGISILTGSMHRYRTGGRPDRRQCSNCSRTCCRTRPRPCPRGCPRRTARSGTGDRQWSPSLQPLERRKALRSPVIPPVPLALACIHVGRRKLQRGAYSVSFDPLRTTSFLGQWRTRRTLSGSHVPTRTGTLTIAFGVGYVTGRYRT